MRKISIKRPVCIISIIFVFLTWSFLSICGGVDLKEKARDSDSVRILGEITNKAYKNGSEILYIKTNDSKSTRYIVYISDVNMSINYLHIGQMVCLYGEYSNFNLPENEGQFNSRKYYRIKGYEAAIKNGKIRSVSKSYNIFLDYLYNIKEKSKKIYEKYLSDEDSGIMEALVLGDKDRLDSEIKELYQDAGFSHILSLSGLHIATVGLFILKLLKKLGFKNNAASIISVVIMVSYALMTGFSTSTIRALIMFVLGLLALCIGRTYDLLSAVNFSIILIIFENPYYVYDSGFLLSVSAVVGIAFLCPIFEDLFINKDFVRRHKEKEKNTTCKNGESSLGSFYNKISELFYMLYTYLIKGFSVSLSAMLGTLPVSLMSFYKISKYGIFLNIIIVPFVGILLFLGCISVITFIAGLHKMSELVLIPVSYILSYYKKTADFAANSYGNNWVMGYPKAWQILAYTLTVLLAVLIYKRGSKFLSIHKKELVISKKKSIYEYTYKFIFLTLLFASIWLISLKNYKNFEVRILSVGQGASNLISGKNNPTIMIDGGSSDVKEVFKYRIKPLLYYNGIDEIDYLFISHPDTDHISGILEMFKDNGSSVKVNHLFMSVYDEELYNLSKSLNISTHIIKCGDKIKNDNLLIECLNPHEITNENAIDLNELSLVIKVTDSDSGYSLLFTGDIGSESEKEIVNCETKNYKNNSNAENAGNTENTGNTKNAGNRCDNDKGERYLLMTVPHHGSKYSSSEEFLKYIQPKISTISCGKDNSYGHPHKETLLRLEEIHTNILRTDISGQITVMIDDNKVGLRRFSDNYE